MRPLLAVPLLLCLAALPLPAAEKEKAKPNTLSPKEAAEGWISLFDGKTTFGWKTEGEVKASDGLLTLGGTKQSEVRTTTEFRDYDLSFEFHQEGKGLFHPGYWATDRRSLQGLQVSPGWNRLVLHVSASQGIDRWELTHMAAPGGSGGGGRGITPWGPSHVVLAIDAGGKVKLRNVKLRPLGLESIFNGKDLAGWKEVKTDRTKSKFSVTDKGELRIQNGPGDLQTEGQWADFVLQAEVFSNGKHLNSGIFFRCLPGQFWSGYEAQIRNQWQGEDRSKPVDYGTGGIYNRQPARKVVSSDKEWFTMTVAANGKHLAVWVNGYQTADFIDTRPPSESARKGSKVDAGPVSLQGHDATTDLLFRNLRIAELPAVAAKK